MHLVIGGAFQGKTAYVSAKFQLQASEICEGEAVTMIMLKRTRAVRHFHLWVRQCMLHHQGAAELARQLIDENPEIIIITDEIGNGIVPQDAFDRRWREQTGRICCELAQRAQSVTRVIGGIPMVIKEEQQ